LKKYIKLVDYFIHDKKIFLARHFLPRYPNSFGTNKTKTAPGAALLKTATGNEIPFNFEVTGTGKQELAYLTAPSILR
jgi:hypothetical protein